MDIPVIHDLNKLTAEIEAGQYSPVYILHGEESYFIDYISDLLESKVLKDEEKGFNQSVVYGKETNMHNLILAAKRFPMMAPYQLIIAKEAQHLADFEMLESYLDNPLKSTILVICYKGKKIDGRSSVSKKLSKFAVFKSEKIKEYQLNQWVKHYLRTKGKSIDDSAANMICEYLGNDLSLLVNEIDKMLLTVHDPFIKVAHVEENIGISKDYNVFELQKALGLKQFNKCIQIANYFASDIRKHSIIMVIGSLYPYFMKTLHYHALKTKPKAEIAKSLGVAEFFVKDYEAAARNYSEQAIEKAIGFLRYYDLRSKGVNDAGTDHGQLLIEMIVQILKL